MHALVIGGDPRGLPQRRRLLHIVRPERLRTIEGRVRSDQVALLQVHLPQEKPDLRVARILLRALQADLERLVQRGRFVIGVAGVARLREVQRHAAGVQRV